MVMRDREEREDCRGRGGGQGQLTGQGFVLNIASPCRQVQIGVTHSLLRSIDDQGSSRDPALAVASELAEDELVVVLPRTRERDRDGDGSGLDEGGEGDGGEEEKVEEGRHG